MDDRQLMAQDRPVSELERLHMNITELHELISVLTDKLAPVRHTVPQNNATLAGGVKDSVAYHISDAADAVSGARSRLGQLLQELAI